MHTYADYAEYEHVTILRIRNGCCVFFAYSAYCLRISLHILRIFLRILRYFPSLRILRTKTGGVNILRIFLHIYCVFLCVFCVFLVSSRSEVSFQTSMNLAF